jgi:hypothetical protein
MLDDTERQHAGEVVKTLMKATLMVTSTKAQ